MAPPDQPDDSLDEAIRRFKKSALDLDSSRAALKTELEDLDQALTESNVRLRAVLDALDEAAAILSEDGTVLLANESFEGLGLGHPGEPPEEPLREMLRSIGESGREGAFYSHETPSGRVELAVRVVPVEDAEDSRLLLVRSRRVEVPPR